MGLPWRPSLLALHLALQIGLHGAGAGAGGTPGLPAWADSEQEACQAASLLQLQARAEEPSSRHGGGTARAAAAAGAHGVAPRAAAVGAAGVGPGHGAGGGDDLVLMHIPYNFGHTIEKVAAFGGGEAATAKFYDMQKMEGSMVSKEKSWDLIKRNVRPGGEIWGHMNPDLNVISDVTKCPMYFTPPKYWPQDLAEAYFKGRTSFGMLRDPYERLVAMFRGNFGSYGGSYPEFYKTCDVNGAVRQMMTSYLAGDIYSGECCFVPQAEYFEGPYGIQLAVDNRRFPDSANEVFAAHNRTDLHIATEDVMHVTGCPDVWAGDLDCETKALVKQVYARDFELLCSNFGYCDREENCCIAGVPQMCPPDLEEKRRTATHCGS